MSKISKTSKSQIDAIWAQIGKLEDARENCPACHYITLTQRIKTLETVVTWLSDQTLPDMTHLMVGVIIAAVNFQIILPLWMTKDQIIRFYDDCPVRTLTALGVTREMIVK